MLNIDQFAYTNRLKDVHPGEKFAFAVLTMAVCLITSSTPVSIIIIGMMAALVLWAKIPARFYVKLLSLPLAFLLIGIITVVLSISRNEPNEVNWLYHISVGSWVVGVTSKDLLLGINIFSKSLATVSCLYFLSLTTPMVELVSVLKKLKVPSLFIELMGLIYRFIFVLMETTQKIQVSQSARYGYATIGNSYRSIGLLVSSLFTKTFQRSQLLYTSLLSRGYTGDLTVLEPEFVYSKKNISLILLVEAALILLAIIFWG